MMILELIGIISLSMLIQSGETYEPGTLCLYQTATFYERFGLEFAYRVINHRTAARVILIHNTSSMWVDKKIVKHSNDVMMLIIGRTSKMFYLWEQLDKKHAVTGFELTGSQIDDGYEPFLDWASRYVPSYDVGNETTLPPHMLSEDSTMEENFADDFMLAKYPNCSVNYTGSNETLGKLVTEESISVYQRFARREYRQEKKMEKGKKVTMYERDMAEDDQPVDEEEAEPEEVSELKISKAKKQRRVGAYRMQYTRKIRNRMLYGRLMKGYDWMKQPYRVESWPRPVLKASRTKRVRSQNGQRNAYFNPNNYALFQQAIKPIQQKIDQIYAAPGRIAVSHGANGVFTKQATNADEVTKPSRAKAVNRVRSATKSKRPRARKAVKSAARAAARPAARAAARPATRAAARPAAKTAARPAAKTAAKPAANAAAKPAVMMVAKSAVKSAAKSAVKTGAKSAVKSAVKSVVKTAAKSVVRKSPIRNAAKSAGKAAAKNAANASAKDKPKLKGRTRKSSTSTLLGYITYMEPGPFVPYINNRVEYNRPQMIAHMG